MLVLVAEGVDLGVGVEVELAVVADSTVLFSVVAKFVAKFRILLVFEASDVVKLLDGVFEEVVQLGGKVLADFLVLALLEAHLAGLYVLFDDCCLAPADLEQLAGVSPALVLLLPAPLLLPAQLVVLAHDSLLLLVLPLLPFALQLPLPLPGLVLLVPFGRLGTRLAVLG